MSYSIEPQPDWYSFPWENAGLRDCHDVLVVGLPTGVAHANTSNIKTNVTDDGALSTLHLSYPVSTLMLNTDMLYKRVAVKDENFYRKMAGHNSYLAKHTGVSSGGTWESDVSIPLPILVRDIHPKVTALKSDSDGSRILQISMESATEPAEAKPVSIDFESID